MRFLCASHHLGNSKGFKTSNARSGDQGQICTYYKSQYHRLVSKTLEILKYLGWRDGEKMQATVIE